MSNLITHINNVSLKERCLCNYLIHNQITPPRWLFKIIRLFVNGQQTTDNSLRVWSLLLKKLYSEFNFNKSYLKILAKRVFMLCLVVLFSNVAFRNKLI